ncbi:MAG TPA: SemiSWEET transporter [Sphingobacteriaceae bacterium]|nr:SemiSWEET transporter [Sphingobacteriaceae bacterium]
MENIKPEIIGLIAGILTSSSLIPQLIKTIKMKEAKDISVIMVISLMCGTGLWSYYGFIKDDLPIIVTNGFSFCLNGVMLMLKAKYSGDDKN